MPQLTRITRDPRVMGGKPCIRRTWADKGLQLNAENELVLLVKALILRDLAGLEKDPKRKAVLETESERLIERQKAIEARKSK
jgi:hypothetical protein